MRRRRIKRVTMGKDPIKHSSTLVSVIGNGSNVTGVQLITTRAGDRSLDGASSTIQDSASNAQIVILSTIVKYITVHLQAAVTTAGNDSSTQGWIEWAVVWRDEVSVQPPSTNFGTQTLGNICTNMYRGDCLLTGNFPVSVNLPNSQDILVKLPKKCVKWKQGAELKLYAIFRDADTTNLETDTVKLITSNNFKGYN